MEKGVAGGARRASGLWSVRGEGTTVEDNGIDIPKRKSSISRQVSFSKGFL
jgi:myosin protein heavy chain